MLVGEATVGIATPGAISVRTGLLKNSNSTSLNGKPIDRDLSAALDQPIKIENDANCLAISEAVDGAGADARVVFGVILGTGVGGSLVINRQVLGRRAFVDHCSTPTTASIERIVASVPGAREKIEQAREKLATAVPTSAPVTLTQSRAGQNNVS